MARAGDASFYRAGTNAPKGFNPADSINRMVKAQRDYAIEKSGGGSGEHGHHHHHMTEGVDSYLRSRLFYAQRKCVGVFARPARGAATHTSRDQLY